MATALEDARITVKTILLPIDFSDTANAALPFARALAEGYGASIFLAPAIPPGPQLDDFAWDDARRKRDEFIDHHSLATIPHQGRELENLVPEHVPDSCTAEFHVRWDYPAEAILSCAEQREADLIVMSVHKARAAGFSSHLPWPIASEVVSRARCPVLTLRI